MGLHYKIISSINSISLLCQVWLLGTPWTGTYQVPHPWISPGKNTGVGYHSLLQVISLTQGSNPGLLHCRKILYHLIHQGSPQLSIFLKFFIIKCCGEIWAVVISEYVLSNDTSTSSAQRGRRSASGRKDLGRPLSWETQLPLFILLDLTLLLWGKDCSCLCLKL